MCYPTKFKSCIYNNHISRNVQETPAYEFCTSVKFSERNWGPRLESWGKKLHFAALTQVMKAISQTEAVDFWIAPAEILQWLPRGNPLGVSYGTVPYQTASVPLPARCPFADFVFDIYNPTTPNRDTARQNTKDQCQAHSAARGSQSLSWSTRNYGFHSSEGPMMRLDIN